MEHCYGHTIRDPNGPFSDGDKETKLGDVVKKLDHEARQEPGGPLMLEFMARKAAFNARRKLVHIDGRYCAAETGTAARIIDSDEIQEVLELDWYPWSRYQDASHLGNKSGKVTLPGHSEFFYKGVRGVAIWASHQDCTRLRTIHSNGYCEQTTVAATVNQR